jgi:hypothetical protein
MSLGDSEANTHLTFSPASTLSPRVETGKLKSEWRQTLKQEQVDTIKTIRDKAAGLIVEVEPQNVPEWDALEKLMEVHKQLRRIDLTKLGQLALLPQDKAADRPMEPVTCPMCNGTKQIVEEQPDADGSGATNLIHVDCPKCRGTGVIPAGQATLDDLEADQRDAAFFRAS